MAARRLTGPVGETPEPESRRSARPDHQAELWGSDAQAELRRIPVFFVDGSFPLKKYYKHRPGFRDLARLRLLT